MTATSVVIVTCTARLPGQMNKPSAVSLLLCTIANAGAYLVDDAAAAAAAAADAAAGI